jgi:hypothetical protein
MADDGTSAQIVMRKAGSPKQGQVLVGAGARSVPHIFTIYSGWNDLPQKHNPSNTNPWSFGPVDGTFQLLPFSSYAEPFG